MSYGKLIIVAALVALVYVVFLRSEPPVPDPASEQSSSTEDKRGHVSPSPAHSEKAKDEANPDVAIRPGDSVAVTGAPAEVKDRDKVVATAQVGAVLAAREVEGSWVKVSVETEGRRVTGWIHRRSLTRVPPGIPTRARRAGEPPAPAPSKQGDAQATRRTEPGTPAPGPRGAGALQPFTRGDEPLRAEERRFLRASRPRFTVTKKGLFRKVKVLLDGDVAKPSLGGAYHVEPGEHLVTVETKIQAKGKDPGYKSFARRLHFNWGYCICLEVERPERERKSSVKLPFSSAKSATRFAHRSGYGVHDRTGGRPGPVMLELPFRFTERSRHVLFSGQPELLKEMSEPLRTPISLAMEKEVMPTIEAAARFLSSQRHLKDTGPLARAASVLRAFKTDRSLEILSKASRSRSDGLRRAVAGPFRTALSDLYSVARDKKQTPYLRKRSVQLLGKFEDQRRRFDAVLSSVSGQPALADAVGPAARQVFRRLCLPDLEHQLRRSPRQCAGNLHAARRYVPFLGQDERRAFRSFLRTASEASDPRLRDGALKLLALLNAGDAQDPSTR